MPPIGPNLAATVMSLWLVQDDRQVANVNQSSAVRTLNPYRPPLWLLLVAASMVTSLSLGVRSTFGLFLDPIVDSTTITKPQFALAIAIQNLIWGLGQPIAGALADRYGSARVLTMGAALYGAGLLMVAKTASAFGLYLSAGLLVGIAISAASFTVVLASVGRTVAPQRRSMALGIVTAMGSVGQFVLVPVVQRLIDSWGWITAVQFLAVAILGIVIVAPVMRQGGSERNQQNPALDDPGHLVDDLNRARRSVSYYLLNFAFFVCGFHVTFIGIHLVSYAEGVGESRRTAALALSLIGLFNIVGSFTAGALGGRYSKTRLLSIIYFGRAVVIAGFVMIPITRPSIIIFGAAIGLLWLSTVPLTSGIVMGQFGPTHAGTLFGVVFLSHQLGAFGGAWLGGALAERAGSYMPVWWIAVGLGVAAAAAHLFIDEGPQPARPNTGQPDPKPMVLSEST